MDRGPAKPTTRFVLASIANAADDFGFACPGIETIANACCCDEHTVMRQIKKLETQGWMTVKRKVLGGRGSVYFISLEKLNITISAKSRRSPIWNEIERLLRALDSGGRLSRMNGVLKFEKPVNGAGIVEVGNLFEDPDSGDNLSPESAGHKYENRAKLPFINASQAILEQNPVAMASEEENPGDNLSLVRCPQSHLTGDFRAEPFNVLNVTSPVSRTVTTPLPPVPGGVGPELIVPFADRKPGDGGFAESLGVAARWVVQRLGITGRRAEDLIAGQLRLRCQSTGETVEQAAVVAVQRRLEYLRDVPQLRFGPWGVKAFFSEGYWQDPQSWPYREPKARAEAIVGIGGQDPARSDERQRNHVAECLRQNAAAISAHHPDTARRLLELAASAGGGMRVDELDHTLASLEEGLCAALLATATEAELAGIEARLDAKLAQLRTRLTAKQTEDMKRERIGVELMAARGLPRLSTFFMRQL